MFPSFYDIELQLMVLDLLAENEIIATMGQYFVLSRWGVPDRGVTIAILMLGKGRVPNN